MYDQVEGFAGCVWLLYDMCGLWMYLGRRMGMVSGLFKYTVLEVFTEGVSGVRRTLAIDRAKTSFCIDRDGFDSEVEGSQDPLINLA